MKLETVIDSLLGETNPWGLSVCRGDRPCSGVKICFVFALQKRKRTELSSEKMRDSQEKLKKKKQFLWKSFCLKKFCLHFLLIIQHPGCVKKYENTFPGGELQPRRARRCSWVVICFLEFHFLINTSVKSLYFQSLVSRAAGIKD